MQRESNGAAAAQAARALPEGACSLAGMFCHGVPQLLASYWLLSHINTRSFRRLDMVSSVVSCVYLCVEISARLLGSPTILVLVVV